MNRNSFLMAGLTALSLVGLSHGSWAQRTLTRDQQLQAAKLIVRAKVAEVTSVKEDAKPSGHDIVSRAKVRVQGSEKGDIKQGQVIEVTYRKVAKRPEGWVGPRGQQHPLKAGSSVRLFLDVQDGNYVLLAPNGWEPLAQW